MFYSERYHVAACSIQTDFPSTESFGKAIFLLDLNLIIKFQSFPCRLCQQQKKYVLGNSIIGIHILSIKLSLLEPPAIVVRC